MLSKRLKNNIREFAQGSIYRLNAKTADCYAFSIVRDKKYLDWEGGWDWSNSLVDKSAEYIYLLKTGKFLKLV